MKEHSANPVFITGIFRSGTSLMYALLNQHPQMALMYECDVWDFPESFSGLRFQNNWLERQEFYNQALSRHRLIFGGRLRGLEKTDTPEKLYRSFSEGRGAGFWGEKSACYCVRLQQLVRQYPGCSLILVWRDPIEIYRSVLNAGRTARFFRRRGMLNRLLYHQEQMIQQAAALSQRGIRIHHVTYNDLIDKTEEVCRGLCGFLEIEYDGEMLDLPDADLSAVYRAPHHDYLRRGVIERQQFTQEIIDPSALKKLQRFRNRWHRLDSPGFARPENPAAATEPGPGERLYHKVVGSLLSALDDGKRLVFEFLPLPWLRTYRQAQLWFWGPRAESAAEHLSLREQLSTHWATILVSCAMLAFVAALDFFTGPNVVLGPFYLIPCAGLTLIVNRRWGTLAAAACALLLTWLRTSGPIAEQAIGLLVWNTAMRFMVFQVVVLLLDRVRLEMNSSGSQPQDQN